MIPKKIHYCWFGNGEKSDLINKCITTWKEYLPEYEFYEWNESNFDINLNSFVLEAYRLKKWAFVTDYVRLYALYNYGGIYLDTDIQITNTFDLFLEEEFFIGLEMKGFLSTAVIGASKANENIKMFWDYYTDRKFSEIPNPRIFTPLLTEKYGISFKEDVLYILEDKVKVYPSNYFCVHIPQNFAIHHFEGSWLDDVREYKTELSKIYHINQLVNEGNNVSDLFSALINHDLSLKKKIIEASILIIKEESGNVYSELESKNQYIVKREAEFDLYIKEKNEERESKNIYIMEKEAEIKSMDQYILEKEEYISGLNKYICSLESKINRIKRTFFYKTFVKIEFFVRRI